MGCVASASVTDLPIVLKFITQQVTPKNALEVNHSFARLKTLAATLLHLPPPSSSLPDHH